MSTGIRTFTLPEWEAILGHDDLERLIGSFSCPVNAEVENFLKTKALQSSRLSASQTYLVCSDRTGLLLGYFTLLLKTYTVKAASLSSANRRLISRFAEEDAAGNFNAAVYLIAQIGKNFAIAKENQIRGCDLLARAEDEFRFIKKRVGGKLVMVERESDRPKLLDFYNSNGFKSWTTRRNAKDGMVYDQRFAVLSDT